MLTRRSQILFNPGPVNLHPAIRANLFNTELCHRQPEFEELDASVRRRLLAAAGFRPGERNLSLLHGSGTLAVDAALASLVRGRVLVPVNGEYCRRLARTLTGLGADVVVDEHGDGTRLDAGELAARLDTVSPDWLALVHHETTTGILNPVPEAAALCEAAGVRLFVDAVSAFPVYPVQGDVVCFNSSKCLESLPGIAGVLWRDDLTVQPVVPVLDVGRYAAGMPSTPHVQAFVALDVALDLLAAEDRPARYHRLARRVWQAGGRRFEPLLAERDRSHVLTSFRLDGADPDPDALLAKALAAGYVIYPGQGELRRTTFRVANMGAAMTEQAIDDLFTVLAP